ncbi:MAG: GWxTD domain-containing protein [Candidatus Eisenbacteria bacterium]
MKQVWFCATGLSVVLFLSGLLPAGRSLSGEVHTERTLKELIWTYPDSSMLYVKLAAIYFAEGTASGRSAAVKQMKLAVKHDRRNPDYRLLLAEMYFESTYWNNGVKELKTLLEWDPENGFAHLRLGEAYLERGVDEWQRSSFLNARDEFQLVEESHPAYPGARRHLAQCYFDLGRPDSSIILLESFPEDSLNVDDLLLLAMALSEIRDIEASSETFTRALGVMDEPRRNRYMSVELVATPEELKEAAATQLTGDMKSANRMLWKKRDPNPATEVNERLVEHLARVGFADFHFTVPRLGKTGSETARGEVYIRYGRPLAWYYDPFGSDVFANETSMPRPAQMSSAMAGVDGWENFDSRDPVSRYRARPIRQARRRWKWQYSGFSLNFEDTFMNGDFRFPYEKDWSAYVYAYLEKNVPEIYESQIKKRMRVVLDALNVVDDMGRAGLKIIYGCDTRGVKYEPLYEWPVGDFDIEVAVLDSIYGDVTRTRFTAELRADSSALYQTEYPLIGSLTVQIPPGGSLAAVSMESKTTGAVGFTNRAVTARGFGDSLEISDIEIRFASDGPPNPSHVYLGRGKAYLAFSIYNLLTDARGTGEAEVSYRIVGREKVEPRFMRLLKALTGTADDETSGGLTSIWSKYELRSRGSRRHEVLGVDLSSLSTGDYDIVIDVTDTLSGRMTTATTGFKIVSEIEQ